MALAQFTASIKTHVAWSEQFPEALIEEKVDTSKSMFVTRAPLVRLHRSKLLLHCGVHGCLGIAADGLGQRKALVGELGDGFAWRELPLVPLVGLRLGDGGLVLGNAAGITHLSPSGERQLLQAGHTNVLLDGPEDGFWSVDFQNLVAMYFDAGGKLVRKVEVDASPWVVADDAGRVCLRGDDAGQLECVDRSGHKGKEKGFQIEPWSKVLGLGAGRLITEVAGGISVQRKGHPAEFLPLLAAGVCTDGKPFVSGYVEGRICLRVGDGPLEWIELPSKYMDGPMPLYVVAVEADRLWVTGERWGIVLDRTGAVVEDFELTEESLRGRLFPRMWTIESVAGLGGSAVMVSCSGPSGGVVLELGLR